jgi:nicotinamidase-related amidase
MTVTWRPSCWTRTSDKGNEKGGEGVSEWTMAGKSGLLIVHMQNSVIKTPSPLEVMGHGKAAREEGVIANIERLVAAFRDKGLPVVYCVTHTPAEVKWPVYGGFFLGSQQIEVNRMGTWDVEIIDELKPVAGERIFYNWPFNVFEGTGLDEYLKEQGVETVVLTGVATGMSVGTAAWAVAERFYNLIIPADATTDGNRDIHELVIGAILPAIGLITTTGDVIEHL